MEQCISIILPVYNAAAYLRPCLESVLTQSWCHLDIILVDDGSTDASPLICDEFALRDPRIRVIHKKNGGASSARNAGLDAARGDYVCFVDSDDLLPKDSVALLAKAVTAAGSQYAAGVCGILGTDRVKHPLDAQRVIRTQEAPEALLDYICTPGSYSPYAKIFDMSIIRQRQLRYNEEHKCSEDSLFIRQYLQSCGSLCLIPQVVYYYNTGNENSLSKKGYPDYCKYFADKLFALQGLTESLPLAQERREAFLAGRAVHGIRIGIRHYFSHWKAREDRMAFIKLCLEVLTPWVKAPDIKSPDLEKWWKRNRSAIQSGNVAALYRHQRREEMLRGAKRRILGKRL